ncbi:MAG: carboxyl transferase domain-containing protein [Oscillospiraceae bacterium]
MASEKLDLTGLLDALFDEGVYTALFESETGALSAAYGLVGGQGAYAVCQNGQAIGTKELETNCRVLRLAGETGCPVVTFYNASGVQLDAGAQVLAATNKLVATAAELSGVVPQIAVVTGPCGGTSALAAASADLCVMTRDAELFLVPPFLAKAEGLATEDSGTLDAAIRAGVVAQVAEDDAEAVQKVAKLLTLLPPNNLAETRAFEYDEPAAALDVAKYTGAGAIDALADAGSALELYPGFGGNAVVALATIAGNVVGIAATNDPHTALGYHCSTKLARFARLCDTYSIPLVTVVNTRGFEMDNKGGNEGGLRQASRLAATYADATCPKVAVLVGRTFGSTYAALAGADLTVAVQGSVTAPVEPTAAVTVLYKDEIDASDKPVDAETKARAAVYEAEVASADALLKAGLASFAPAPDAVRGSVATALDILASKRLQRLPKKHGNMPL